MKTKRIMGLALAAAMCASLSMSAMADDDFHLELKMSHVFAPNEQLTITMQEICDNILEKTDGAIEIQHYPQGQLATYKDGVEQVARGANFISVEDPSYLGDYVADFNVLAGPMLVTSFDQYEYLLESQEVQDMIAALEEKGIKVLNLDYIFGFRSMMTNKVIEKPEDMKGMKIRTPGSQLYVDTLNHMGAVATPMAFSETIAAVQSGVVDGLEGTIDAYATNGSAEVAKNMALTKHLLGVCGAYISTEVWATIPEEYQTIIQDEFNAGAERMVATITENEAATMEKLENEMGVTFNEVDSDAFKELVAPIYTQMEEEMGTTAGLYDRFQEIIAEMPAE